MTSTTPLPHTVSYAKSSRAQCKACHSAIEARNLRMGITSLSPFFDGVVVKYYHVNCYFKKNRGKDITTSKLEGFRAIQWSDQDRLRKLFGEPTVHDASNTIKDFKTLVSKLNNHTLTPIEENTLDWSLRAKLEDECSLSLIRELLLLNGQSVSGGEDDILRRCSQGLIYGAVSKCPQCSKGNLHFDDVENKWQCSEFTSAWSKCPFSLDGLLSVPRTPFVVQYTSNKFLLSWCTSRSMPPVKPRSEILNGLVVVMAGRVGRTKNDLEEFLERHSAVLAPKVVRGETTHVVTSDNVLYKGSTTTAAAEQHNIPIVYEEFFDQCIAAGKLISHEPYIIIKGKPKTFSEAGEAIGEDSSSSSASSSGGGGANSTTTSSASSTSLSSAPPVKLTKFREELQVADFSLIGFDEDDYMVDNCTQFDYSADLSIFNAHLANQSNEFEFQSIPESTATTTATTPDTFDLVKSYESALIGFAAIKMAAQEKVEVVKVVNENKNTKRFRWPVLPGKEYSSVAKQYVDTETKLESTHHVYEDRSQDGSLVFYDLMLNQTEITTGRNAYYKMQLLVPDAPTSKKFYVFFKWGRVGTDIGHSKLMPVGSLDTAKSEFEKKFYDKTSNRWREFINGGFIKCGGKMFPLDIEYESEQLSSSSTGETQPSTLDSQVQELIKLIFDPRTMQRALEHMKIDIQKMPLGKISKKLIADGYQVLKQIDDILGSTPTLSAEQAHRITDLSNRFYTIVPHSFGRDKPPMLDTLPILREKMDMLQTLGDIEVASSMLKSSPSDDSNLHPIDRKYQRLGARIAPLDMSSSIAKQILQFVKNSQSRLHQLKVEVEQIYVVERESEKMQFARFDFLQNRKFLWHGSRLSNFVGILSQGLRVAPPEAPHSGFMFGKGVYFADMVSKSALYCHADASDGIGLMLLSEVALGDTYDVTQAKYIEKAFLDTIGKNSTRAIGKYGPSPKGDAYLAPTHRATAPMGLEEPVGPPDCELDHHEYIVYDMGQILSSFLLKLRISSA